MRLYIFLLIAIILSGDVFAQFAVINDPDGYTNIRKEPNSKSEILGQIKENEVFFTYEELENESEWIYVEYKKGATFDEVSTKGYMHKSRMRPLESLQAFKRIEINEEFVVFSQKNLIVEVKSGAFHPELHQIKKGGENWIDKIDGKDFYGTDGPMPKREIKWIILIIDSKRFEIPQSNFNNFYEPNLDYMEAWLGPEDHVFLEMHNSDGAGAYSVVLVFNNGKVVEKMVGRFY